MIETAIIPAAGLGTRMRPLTGVLPKEMFPVGTLPMIGLSLRELVSSGVKKICIVIRSGKEIIREYLTERHSDYRDVELNFVYQERPLGLGDAMRQAKKFIGDRAFLMLIPDQILLSDTPAAKQLLNASGTDHGIWNSMVDIPPDELRFFKGSRPFSYRKGGKDYFIVQDILDEEVSSSTVRGFGRTIFPAEALEYMTEKYMNERTGEVDLLKTFKALREEFPLYGTLLEGAACDLGTWQGYYHYQKVISRHMSSRDTAPWS